MSLWGENWNWKCAELSYGVIDLHTGSKLFIDALIFVGMHFLKPIETCFIYAPHFVMDDLERMDKSKKQVHHGWTMDSSQILYKTGFSTSHFRVVHHHRLTFSTTFYHFKHHLIFSWHHLIILVNLIWTFRQQIFWPCLWPWRSHCHWSSWYFTLSPLKFQNCWSNRYET